MVKTLQNTIPLQFIAVLVKLLNKPCRCEFNVYMLFLAVTTNLNTSPRGVERREHEETSLRCKGL